MIAFRSSAEAPASSAGPYGHVMPRPDRSNARADAIALINDVFGHMFPGLHAS